MAYPSCRARGATLLILAGLGLAYGGSVEASTTDYPAPQLHTAKWSGSSVHLAWSYSGSTPPGGFDLIVDGADTNKTYRTNALEQTVGPLSNDSHCFVVEARYSSDRVFPQSNTLCIQAQGAEAPAPSGHPAPRLHTAAWSGSNVYLAWSYSDSIPPGGFDLIVDGADTNKTYRTHALEQTVGPLSNASHCFVVEARYNGFPQSNTLCIQAQGGGSTNQPPVIGGSPLASVSVGEPYDFTPTASDPDGDSLQFSATNLPSWAAINASSGRITGTPAAGDVGTWSNVRISVSDGSASDELGPFSIDVVATGTASVNVSWTPPTEREDGTPLNGLAGYRVYVGRSPDTLDRVIEVQNGGISSYTVEGLTSGTWYLAVKAFDSDGLASRLSSIVPASAN